MSGRNTTFRCKIITLFILLGVKVSMVCVRQKDRGRRMEIAILTHNLFSWSYNTVLSSSPHIALLLLLGLVGHSTGSPLWTATPAAGGLHDYLFSSGWKLRLTARLPVLHVDICIYHFITPTHFRLNAWLLPLIFTGASYAENPRLTARSRVNMQHTETNKTHKKC